MDRAILDVIHRIQLPDNATRQRAEEELSQLVTSDPSQAAIVLINIAKTSDAHIAIRQSALLNLKRIVPLFWSAGFDSFRGPAINQDSKIHIRSDLLNLITGDPDSKIRSGGAYAVVQIAAVDYPDEWPDLLDILYTKMTSLDPIAVLGGLSLLQDLFDDLVTEEQFFEGGVGIATITQCLKLLSSDQVADNIKAAAATLYKSCLLQLQSPDVLESPQKRAGLEQHFKEIVTLLTVILQKHSLNIHSIILRTTLYSIAYTLNTEFPEKLFENNAKIALQQQVANDIISTSKVFVELVVLENEDTYTDNNDLDISTSTSLNNLLIEQFQFLGSLNKLKITQSPIEYFLDSVLVSCFIPLEAESEWLGDYNVFVTDETGVSPDFVARNAVFEYLSELNKEDANSIFNWCVKKLQQFDGSDDWRSKEALLYALGGLLQNDVHLHTDISLVEILNSIASLLQDKEVLVRARAILIIPEFLEKFKDSLSTKDFGIESMMESLRIASNDESPVLTAAFLVSLTYYNSILEFQGVPKESQEIIFRICEALLEDSEEDTPSLLAETLTLALKINRTSIRALNLLFRIASRDPGNIQLVIDIEEALEALLADVDLQTYLSYAQTSLPGLLATLESSNYEFSAQLSLAIQILNIFIYNCPQSLPQSLFNIINPVLAKLLLQATDDQLLQLGGDAYTSLVKVSEADFFDVGVVLEILSKFLDPNLSDSAAMNVGSLVVSVITKFSANLESILPQILEATTRRLIAAKELSTVEDLLSVLCYMVSIDVDQTINFLQNFEIQTIFNIWFKNFETLRGVKIKENCEALAKIYLANKSFEFTVDGDEYVDLKSDIIITRSMRRKQEFQQVSVPFKIIKCLVFELNSQAQHRDIGEATDYAHDDHDHDHDHIEQDDGDEGWEDLDDIGDNFEKFQSYIDDDRDHGDADDDLKEFLINFFKTVASQNIQNFKEIYNNLRDEEKQVLTENVV